jgi:tetratricopeptide (TPR) repeat protein
LFVYPDLQFCGHRLSPASDRILPYFSKASVILLGGVDVIAPTIREILAGSLIIAALAGSAAAQGGGGQGGQAPAPPPASNPGNDAPRVPNVPAPQPAPRETVTSIRGRILTGDNTLQNGITEVRIELDGGQPVGFAYANTNGEFFFQQTGMQLDQNVYVAVKVDGFKEHRERVFLTQMFSNNVDAFVSIFLEREPTIITVGPRGSAIVDLKQLRAKIPGKAVDEYEKAQKESSKGNRNKAIEGLQRAVKLAPDFYEAQYSLGVQYLNLSQLDEAESAFTRARDLSPKSAEPLANLGAVYYQRGETQNDAGQTDKAAATFEKAADLLEEAIQRDPLSPGALGYLGAALYKLGDYDEAEATLKRSLDLDADQHNARLMLINVYTRSSRYPEALEQIGVFLKRNPKAPQRASLENIKQQLEKSRPE